MWTLAVTGAAAELQVRDALVSQGLSVFCPYTIEKQRVKVRGKGRDQFKVTVSSAARWPRYLFANILDDSDLIRLFATRGIHSIVRSTDGLPSVISDRHMDALRTDCGPDGLVLKRSSLLNYSVTDMLRFVAPSPFAGKVGEVLSIDRLDDTGELTMAVGNHPARVHYSTVARA